MENIESDDNGYMAHEHPGPDDIFPRVNNLENEWELVKD